MEINISIKSNGIHRTAHVNIEKAEVDELPLIASVLKITEEYNRLALEQA